MINKIKTLPLLAALLAALVGCAPDFDDAPALVDGPRILALQAEPAERAPGEPVRLTALVAAPPGTPTPTPTLRWCSTARPVAEGRVGAADCLDGTALAAGPATVVPADACAVFGPSPATEPDRVPRPADADATGGYHQPVHAALPGAAAVGRVRLRCPLPSAPAPVAARFAREAPRNANPVVTAAPLAEADGVWALAATVDAPEAYLRYDLAAADLEAVDEVHTASWYATAGELEVLAGPGEPPRARFRPAADAAAVWLVVRDDRGGVAWVVWSR